MAVREHVAMVREGRRAIDAWREEHPYERLDLEGADLSGDRDEFLIRRKPAVATP